MLVQQSVHLSDCGGHQARADEVSAVVGEERQLNVRFTIGERALHSWDVVGVGHV